MRQSGIQEALCESNVFIKQDTDESALSLIALSSQLTVLSKQLIRSEVLQIPRNSLHLKNPATYNFKYGRIMHCSRFT